jgi:hypothetical protein
VGRGLGIGVRRKLKEIEAHLESSRFGVLLVKTDKSPLTFRCPICACVLTKDDVDISKPECPRCGEELLGVRRDEQINRWAEARSIQDDAGLRAHLFDAGGWVEIAEGVRYTVERPLFDNNRKVTLTIWDDGTPHRHLVYPNRTCDCSIGNDCEHIRLVTRLAQAGWNPFKLVPMGTSRNGIVNAQVVIAEEFSRDAYSGEAFPLQEFPIKTVFNRANDPLSG